VRSGPITPVERPVLNCLGEMANSQSGRAFEIGDGARYLQDAIVGAGAQSLLLHGALQQPFRVCAKFTIGANLPRPHLRVGENSLACLLKTPALPVSCAHDPVANLR